MKVEALESAERAGRNRALKLCRITLSVGVKRGLNPLHHYHDIGGDCLQETVWPTWWWGEEKSQQRISWQNKTWVIYITTSWLLKAWIQFIQISLSGPALILFNCKTVQLSNTRTHTHMGVCSASSRMPLKWPWPYLLCSRKPTSSAYRLRNPAAAALRITNAPINLYWFSTLLTVSFLKPLLNEVIKKL